MAAGMRRAGEGSGACAATSPLAAAATALRGESPGQAAPLGAAVSLGPVGRVAGERLPAAGEREGRLVSGGAALESGEWGWCSRNDQDTREADAGRSEQRPPQGIAQPGMTEYLLAVTLHRPAFRAESHGRSRVSGLKAQRNYTSHPPAGNVLPPLTLPRVRASGALLQLYRDSPVGSGAAGKVRRPRSVLPPRASGGLMSFTRRRRERVRLPRRLRAELPLRKWVQSCVKC